MRLVHKATDDLSPEAIRVMTEGFRLRKTYAAIAKDLDDIDEPVPERTIARRAVEWRREQARRQSAREQVQDLVSAMKSNDLSAAEMVQALAMQALLDDPEAYAEKDPIRVQKQALTAEEIRLKKRKQELAERRLELDEQKYRAQQEREEKARAAADEAAAKAARGESLTVDDINRIRDIYGMKPVEARG
jgi:hypothetical protein